MDKFCRLCLKEDRNNIFTEFYSQINSSVTVFDCYKILTSINFEDQDERYKSKVCVECLQNLIAFYDHRCQAIKNNSLILKMSSNGSNILPIPHIEIKQEFFEEITTGKYEVIEDPFKAVFSVEELKIEEDPKDLVAFEVFNNSEVGPQIKSINKPNNLVNSEEVKSTKILKNQRKKSNSDNKTFHQKAFTCDVCSRSFSSKEYLQFHLNKHFQIRDVNCSDCDRKFHHKIDFFVHFNSKHKKEPVSTCTYPNCFALFKKKRIMAEHIKFVHLNERNYLCQICSKTFYTRTKLKRHESSHEVNLIYNCSFEGCTERFTSIDKMQKHGRVSHAPKKYFCDYCPRAYDIPSKIRVHIQKSHQNNYQSVKRPKKLKLPKEPKVPRVKLGKIIKEEAKFDCPDCLTSFPAWSQLLTHKKDMHFKRMKCQYCSTIFPSFKTIPLYRRHAKRVHRYMEKNQLKEFLEQIDRYRPDFERMIWTL